MEIELRGLRYNIESSRETYSNVRNGNQILIKLFHRFRKGIIF